MNNQKRYDYIISGAGCAGLSLAMQLTRDNAFSDKSILIADKDPKDANDRTWCFWEKDQGLFEPVVYHKWDKLWVHGAGESRLMQIRPYVYKLIRGRDFYRYCLDHLEQQPNVSFIRGEVSGLFNTQGGAGITIGEQQYEGQYVFNSILFQKPQLGKGVTWLLQHFRGFLIRTEKRCFDPEVATLMDFRTDQSEGTCFFYVLPFSDNEALIEYTVFSGTLFKEDQYEIALRQYISDTLHAGPYSIIEKEQGVIPMTSHKFPVRDGNIIYMGTAGGRTKGSSGYTFRFIQDHALQIRADLEQNRIPSDRGIQWRFRFYDAVLLDVLEKRVLGGDRIFTRLFMKNQPSAVLEFLDQKSSIATELSIISSLPTGPFFKAAMRQV